MRPADVKRLMDAMVEADVHELELEQHDGEQRVSRLRLVRAAAGVGVASPAASVASARSPEAAPAVAEGPLSAPPAEVTAASRLVDVAAPIVGTFYASPAPDAGPYVKPGDRVQVGAVLCIIEAMKLMNEIEAEVSGTIVEVLVKNEDPVEYGQVLFRIDPG
jgi:acetyl-CoA carboxylase biotin carboxyl carrier protein